MVLKLVEMRPTKIKHESKVYVAALDFSDYFVSKSRVGSILQYPTAGAKTSIVPVMGYLLSCILPHIAKNCQQSLQARGGGESPKASSIMSN